MGTSRSFNPSRTEYLHYASISIPCPWEKALLGQLSVSERMLVFFRSQFSKAAGLLAEREHEGKKDTQ